MPRRIVNYLFIIFLNKILNNIKFSLKFLSTFSSYPKIDCVKFMEVRMQNLIPNIEYRLKMYDMINVNYEKCLDFCENKLENCNSFWYFNYEYYGLNSNDKFSCYFFNVHDYTNNSEVLLYTYLMFNLITPLNIMIQTNTKLSNPYNTSYYMSIKDCYSDCLNSLNCKSISFLYNDIFIYFYDKTTPYSICNFYNYTNVVEKVLNLEERKDWVTYYKRNFFNFKLFE